MKPRLVACALALMATGMLLGAPRAANAATGTYPGPGMVPFGDAYSGQPLQATTFSSLITATAPTPDGQGYWLVGADGSVVPVGDAKSYGDLTKVSLSAPIVGFAPTSDGLGYWMVGMDGGIFAFGDAKFYGSMGAVPLNQPIVGMASTPDNAGYWLVAADGGIFAFGDAKFYGSMGAVSLVASVVGMATTPDAKGYWMVAADGGIFSFGDAAFFGSMGGKHINDSVVGMARTTDGSGYWLAGNDGGVFSFGDARYLGSTAANPVVTPVDAITATPDAKGYWLLEPMNWRYSFATPSPRTIPDGPAIVAAAESQVGWNSDTSAGPHCNPYGPCEEWCALFSTWVWQQGAVPIPSYPLVSQVYDWAAAQGTALGPGALAAPGDAVLYGTGPENLYTAVHMGIVAEAWPDGALVTIEGDAGPGPTGYGAVIINGPFLPADSPIYNGYPIFAYAEP